MNLEKEKSDRQFRDISHISASVQINELAESHKDTSKSTNLREKKKARHTDVCLCSRMAPL